MPLITPFRYGAGAIPARCCAEPVSVLLTGVPGQPGDAVSDAGRVPVGGVTRVAVPRIAEGTNPAVAVAKPRIWCR